MDARTYKVLIEVHTRRATYLKGQVATLSELGGDAMILISWGLVKPVAYTARAA